MNNETQTLCNRVQQSAMAWLAMSQRRQKRRLRLFDPQVSTSLAKSRALSHDSCEDGLCVQRSRS